MGRPLTGQPVGRPPKEIGEEELIKLLGMKCPVWEIASWFECSEDTVERKCLELFGVNFAELKQRYSFGTNISLRRKQYLQAMEGDTKMLIHLGKYWLGQWDVPPEKANDDNSNCVEKLTFQVKGNANNNPIPEAS